MGVKKDIDKAKYFIKTMDFCRDDSDIFDMLYIFTNENIKDMFANFNFKDKVYLSVLASSDQVLDMYLRGAKKVTTFDINPLTKYLFYLKRTALASGISKEEYFSYFCYKTSSLYGYNKDAFSKKTFNKIVPYLYGDSYKFWSSLYDEFKGIEIREDRFLFSFDECLSSTLKHTVSYLNEKNYNKISEMASSIDIKFIN